MVKEITVYTRKDAVVDEVRERLTGTDISITVDDTFIGRFQDPSFIDHNGKRLVGYTPLFQYVDAIASGEENPTVENPIGDAMEKCWPRPNLAFQNYRLFGNFFDTTKEAH
jgi:hypothetical protein